MARPIPIIKERFPNAGIKPETGRLDNTQDLLKLEFKYNTTGNNDNNGSMREQKITIPNAAGQSGFTATQVYTYDALNRIQSATETVSGSQTWKQTFDYDRFGNRRFNRFTSVDPLTASATVRNPQSFNRYAYVVNSPYKFIDPLGLREQSACTACGNPNSYDLQAVSRNGIAGAGNYYSGESPGLRSASETGYNETRTVYLFIVESGAQSAEVKVVIVERIWSETDGNGGEIVQAGVQPRTDRSVKVDVSDTSGKGFSDQQKQTIKEVTKDIVTAARETGVNPRMALAIGIKESLLGIGAATSANINPKTGKVYPHKAADVNPLQLSGGRASAGKENRKNNIIGALND